ncbi:MAG: glycosyltransferase family 4 protein [Phycisphaerae bacterium]
MATRILCVLNRLPYPVIGGREKMICQALDFMCRTDSEIHLVVFEPEHHWKSLPDRFNALKKRYGKIERITTLGMPNRLYCLVNIFFRTFVFGRKSLQESLFYSFQANYRLAKITRAIKPDVIYCDSARTAQFFEYSKTKARKVFDADDLLSKRYRIMEMGSQINLLGSFVDKMPRTYKWLGSGIISRALVRLEARLMFRRENTLARVFNHVILVSPVEGAELQDRIKEANVHYIYPTTRTVLLDRPELQNGESPVISFMGLLNIPHNQIGLQGFLENIFPKIIRQVPNVRFQIIGSNAPKKIIQLASRFRDNVVFAGFVENFADALKTTRVFVAPIYFGTGIKTKIIDAMALGLPVVTTPIGAEGLSIQNRENIMIAEDDNQFADCVVELLKDSSLNKHISEQARLYIQEHHNPDKEAQRFWEILGLRRDD